MEDTQQINADDQVRRTFRIVLAISAAVHLGVFLVASLGSPFGGARDEPSFYRVRLIGGDPGGSPTRGPEPAATPAAAATSPEAPEGPAATPSGAPAAEPEQPAATEPEQPAVVTGDHFVHTVAEQESPVHDGDLRLIQRNKIAVQIDLRLRAWHAAAYSNHSSTLSLIWLVIPPSSICSSATSGTWATVCAPSAMVTLPSGLPLSSGAIRRGSTLMLALRF